MLAAERGPLVPGLPERVWIAVAVDGRPADRPPAVDATGGTVRFAPGGGGAGVWPLIVTAGAGSSRVDVAMTVAGAEVRRSLEVEWPALGGPTVPDRVDGAAQGEPIRIPVTGPDLPPPEHLAVAVSEGVVQGVVAVEGGLEILVQPDDIPFPRVVSYGIRDVRGAARPTWGNVRLRSRPRLPLALEPGAKVTITVGGRTYGPLTADADGQVVARIEQFPGETSAEAVLTDDLGNRSTFVVPLTGPGEPTLIAVPGERGEGSGRPRLVWLRASGATGGPWRGASPECRSASTGALEVIPVGQGVYAVPLEGRVPPDLLDVRLECRLGSEAATTVRASAPAGLPDRVLLQIWPSELSTDLPIAEIRVALEDARGQRLPVDAVAVRAERGTVRMQPDGTGEYDGSAAVAAGADVVLAEVASAAGEGPPARVRLAWDAVPVTGAARVSARAEDADGRGVAGAPLAVDAGVGAVTGMSGDDGWVVLDVPVPVGAGPLVIEGRSGDAVGRRPAQRGPAGAVERPGALLGARRQVTLSPGRVAGISLDVDPPILRTGRGAVAWVTVTLEDQAGRPLADELVTVEASEGTVGPLVARPDGTWLAEYEPLESDRPREVLLTARTESLRSTARLTLEPRLGRVSLGPWAGWVTNLGAVSSPVVGLDADVRTGLLAESIVVRLGLSGHGIAASAETGVGDDVELRGGVFPGLAALLIRQDRGGLGVWGGAGGVVGIQTQRTRFGPTLVSRGSRLVTGGAVVGGAGTRLGLGDLFVEGRYLWVPAVGGELGFTGNLGGLSVGAGFRLVY